MSYQTDEFSKPNYKEKEIYRFKGKNILRRNSKKNE